MANKPFLSDIKTLRARARERASISNAAPSPLDIKLTVIP